jgi:hypothetical protein
MKISSAFPSNYLKAADLQDRNVMVKMDRVSLEKIGDDEKPVLYFVGKEKGMVLNKTNAQNIAVVYGDDTTDWRDQDLVLFTAMVDFQGKTVEAIRVRAPQPKDRRPAQRQADPISSGPQRQTGGVSDTQLTDDEIPF